MPNISDVEQADRIVPGHFPEQIHTEDDAFT